MYPVESTEPDTSPALSLRLPPASLKTLLALLAALTAVPLAVRAQPERAAVAIFQAISHADTASLRPLLGDDLRWVIASTGAAANKAQLLIAAAAAVPMASNEFAVDSIQTWQHGDIAITEYRLTNTRAFHDYRLVLGSRATDVFALRGGRWLLIRHTTTWIVHSPPTIDIDSAQAAAFVGRYDKGGGFIDDVHFQDGHLVAQSTLEKLIGASGATLLPVSHDTFSPDGMAPMIVFERDATGRVLGYVQQSPDGTIARARRITP